MSDRIRRMTARQVEGLLRQHGFLLISQKGSHRKWRNPEKRLQVTVPAHRGAALCRLERFARFLRGQRFQSLNGRIEDLFHSYLEHHSTRNLVRGSE